MKLAIYALALIGAFQPCLAGIVTVSSDITIAPGDTYDGIDVRDSPPSRTAVTVLGGTTTSLRVLDSAVANVYGGTVFSLSAGDQGTLNLFGLDYSAAIGAGGSARINIYGTAPEVVQAVQTASVYMFPGSQASDVGVRGSGRGSIYGGLVQTILSANNSGDLRLYGGEIGDYLIAEDNSTVEIYGSGFSYNPTRGQLGMGLIHGSWLDGTPLSISLATAPGSPDDTYSHITFVPEPSTLVLLTLGGLAANRRR